jgi:peptidoglycan L-alanyl-D-glutamate endopeptidase CwlK
MDLRSEANLAQVNPALAGKVRAAADILAGAGTFLLVVSGLRTSAEQDALYYQGRTSAGHIVTNARAGFSMHNYGLAVDVVPYLSGLGGKLNYNADTEQFRVMVAELKAQGLVWGGDWQHLKDMDHFQMPGLPVTPNEAMRAAYGDGAPQYLKAIWADCTTGKFATETV